MRPSNRRSCSQFPVNALPVSTCRRTGTKLRSEHAKLALRYGANEMRILLRPHSILVLIGNYVKRLRRSRSPIVSQSELVLLLKMDRSDVAGSLRLEDSLHRRPRRGAYPTPRKTVTEWRDFITWLDKGIAHLENQRSTAELEAFVRDWQSRRKAMEASIWPWNRKRADVIPICLDPEQRTSAP
jgi:hypothetical protein